MSSYDLSCGRVYRCLEGFSSHAVLLTNMSRAGTFLSAEKIDCHHMQIKSFQLKILFALIRVQMHPLLPLQQLPVGESVLLHPYCLKID